MSDIDSLREAFETVGARARFTRRPVDIPGDSRISWRICVLCMILHRGRANSLTLEQLHVLWWAIRSKETRDLFLRWHRGEKAPDEFLVRFDPSLTSTVDLAIGQALAYADAKGTVKLTTSGLALAIEVEGTADVLMAEKAFLEELPSRISQAEIRRLLEWS